MEDLKMTHNADLEPIAELMRDAEDVTKPPPVEMTMPYRVGTDFEVSAKGVFFLEAGEGEGPVTRELVCSPIHVAARTRDENGESWGALVQWRDADGREHEWAMPAAMLAGDGLAVREALLNRGVTIAQSRKARERLMGYLGHKPEATASTVIVHVSPRRPSRRMVAPRRWA